MNEQTDTGRRVILPTCLQKSHGKQLELSLYFHYYLAIAWIIAL